MLSRDEILGAQDLPHEDVNIPEWGGTVRVRCMTGSQRDRFESLYLGGSKKDARAMLAAFTLVNEANQPLFTEADIKVLGSKSASALDRVLEVALRLGRVTQADIEELEKNSVAIPSGSGATDTHGSNGVQLETFSVGIAPPN